MFDEKFVVGCEGVAWHNGVVVIDLTGLSPRDKDSQGRPKIETNQRIVTTPVGLVELFNNLQNMMNTLVERGILTRNQPAADGQEGGGESGKGGNGGTQDEGGPQSPNF